MREILASILNRDSGQPGAKNKVYFRDVVVLEQVEPCQTSKIGKSRCDFIQAPSVANCQFTLAYQLEKILARQIIQKFQGQEAKKVPGINFSFLLFNVER